MRGLVAVLLFTLLTIVSWGSYGPMLNIGQLDMGDTAGLKSFICVGMAYFAIAVVVPVVALQTVGDPGRWTVTGIIWGLIAGAVGAVGALAVLMALVFHGAPVFVMPLVYGGAPVINTFFVMFLNRSYKQQIGPFFIAGLILVIAGALMVLFTRPDINVGQEVSLTAMDMLKIFGFILLAAAAWGTYGVILHKGQAAMLGSRLRPFICVGVAYFIIAVLFPVLLMTASGQAFDFTWRGSWWSFLSGAAGAIGALGVIMAFAKGGKPIYVMPLIFGGAPIVNTMISLWQAETDKVPGPFFYAGLIIVVLGSVTVLVFAPKPSKSEEKADALIAKKTAEAAAKPSGAEQVELAKKDQSFKPNTK